MDHPVWSECVLVAGAMHLWGRTIIHRTVCLGVFVGVQPHCPRHIAGLEPLVLWVRCKETQTIQQQE